jgi:hypothetical protein
MAMVRLHRSALATLLALAATATGLNAQAELPRLWVGVEGGWHGPTVQIHDGLKYSTRDAEAWGVSVEYHGRGSYSGRIRGRRVSTEVRLENTTSYRAADAPADHLTTITADLLYHPRQKQDGLQPFGTIGIGARHYSLQGGQHCFIDIICPISDPPQRTVPAFAVGAGVEHRIEFLRLQFELGTTLTPFRGLTRNRRDDSLGRDDRAQFELTGALRVLLTFDPAAGDENQRRK